MGILDDFLDSAEGPPWGDIAAAFVGGLGASRSAVSKSIMNTVLQWGAHLTKRAMTQWVTVVESGAECHFPECSTGAIATCVCCKKHFCLGHVLINYHAEAICELCAQSAVRARAAVSSEEERRRAALKVLGLDDDASWEEVRTRYRQLVVKHNADRPQSAARRKKNTERLKAINAAYETLRQQQESRAA